jgi:hypothetical protein
MQLRTLYEKLCSELPSSRFVYLPLHFQPERTTHPEGGIWANQALLIRTIRDALPKEIELVVKEHPVQFANWPPNIRTRHYRSSIFYESIEAIPGVSLLSSEVSTATIGERADFVCTIQGNAALEFIRIGKPAVTMRWTWLDGCEGYFYPHDGQVRRTIEDALELQLQGKNLLRSWDQFRFDAPDHIFNVPSHHSELAVMAGDKNQIARNVGEVADLISSA